jgi:hypothetical protein
MKRVLLAVAVMAAVVGVGAVQPVSAEPVSQQCVSDDTSVKVEAEDSPATISVTDTTTNTAVSVVLTITGSDFAITTPDGATYTLSSASWCVKSSLSTTDPSPGTGLTGSSTSVNKKGVVQDIGYVTLYSVTTTPATTCYDSTVAVNFDLVLVGLIDTAGNARSVSSTDGSCSGDPLQIGTFVAAADKAEADAKCQAVDRGNAQGALVSFGYNAPSDYWVCQLAG